MAGEAGCWLWLLAAGPAGGGTPAGHRRWSARTKDVLKVLLMVLGIDYRYFSTFLASAATLTYIGLETNFSLEAVVATRGSENALQQSNFPAP